MAERGNRLLFLPSADRAEGAIHAAFFTTGRHGLRRVRHKTVRTVFRMAPVARAVAHMPRVVQSFPRAETVAERVCYVVRVALAAARTGKDGVPLFGTRRRDHVLRIAMAEHGDRIALLEDHAAGNVNQIPRIASGRAGRIGHAGDLARGGFVVSVIITRRAGQLRIAGGDGNAVPRFRRTAVADGLERAASRKRVFADRNELLLHRDAAQRRAVVERALADSLDVVRQIQSGQSLTFGKRVRADRRHPNGDGGMEQLRAAVKRIGADRHQAFRQIDGGKLRAAFKRSVADLRHGIRHGIVRLRPPCRIADQRSLRFIEQNAVRIGAVFGIGRTDREPRQRVAAAERIVADTGDFVRDRHLRQAFAAVERVFADARHVRRNDHAAQIFAAVKRAGPDARNAFRHRNGRERAAAVEHAPTDGFDAGRKRRVQQAGTLVKRHFTDRSHGIRERDVFQIRACIKRASLDRRHPVRNGIRRQSGGDRTAQQLRLILVEQHAVCVRAVLRVFVVDGERLQFAAAGESLQADARDARRDRDLFHQFGVRTPRRRRRRSIGVHAACALDHQHAADRIQRPRHRAAARTGIDLLRVNGGRAYGQRHPHSQTYRCHSFPKRHNSSSFA